jgi:DNA-binding transcriptional LysR family regulator
VSELGRLRHGSWLNQVEIWFGILTRTALRHRFFARERRPRAPLRVDLHGLSGASGFADGGASLRGDRRRRRVQRFSSGSAGSSLIAAANAALMGMGLTVVPAHLVAAEPTLRPIGHAFLHSDIWLVVRPDLSRMARVRTVMDFVAEVVSRGAALVYGEK